MPCQFLEEHYFVYIFRVNQSNSSDSEKSGIPSVPFLLLSRAEWTDTFPFFRKAEQVLKVHDHCYSGIVVRNNSEKPGIIPSIPE